MVCTRLFHLGITVPKDSIFEKKIVPKLQDVNPSHAAKLEYVLFPLYPLASEERSFILTLQRFVK